MANDNAKVAFNIDNLQDLIKSLKQDYFVRVGIIGSKATTSHNKGDLTNAELGTIHEQPNNDGTKMPKRSFLEMPLKEKLKYDENQFKQIKKSAYNSIFIKKNPKDFFNMLGSACLQIIEDAFATNGFGSWQSWSDSYTQRRLKAKKTKKGRETFWSDNNILTNTKQLRRSISFKTMKGNNK